MAPRERRVVWARSAQQALDDVISYIAADSRANALRVLDQALDAANSLSTLAERGRIVPETRDPAIDIIAFVHGARDFAALQRDTWDE